MNLNEQISNAAGLVITAGAAGMALNMMNKSLSPDKPHKRCNKCGSKIRKTVFNEEYCPRCTHGMW